jgi:hypothetical protein
MRVMILVLVVATGVFVSLMGFRGAISDRQPLLIVPDMVVQPRYHAQDESPFFPDGGAMRTPPAGSVPFGGADYASDAGSPRLNPDLLAGDDRYYRGKEGAGWVARNPVKIDLEFLKRGHERYDIYCAPCHGMTGSGNGLMTQYGLVGVASITDEFHALMPDGEFFNVITTGKGRMVGMASQIKPGDRWAIVAYLRALMRSQNASLGDVPEVKRGELK